MASRHEEKERRRQERLAEEQAAAEKARRGRLLRIGVGAGLTLIAVAAVAIALVGFGGDDSTEGGDGSPGPAARIPAPDITDLDAAAKAAGCRVRTYNWTNADRTHVGDSVKVKYRTNPPAFGDHYNTPSSDGNYVGQGTPKTGNLVHSLEHGRIEIQYRPGLPVKQVAQLEALFDEKLDPYDSGQYLLLFENKTKMPGDVAAAAWGHNLACPTFNSKVFDAIRAFRLKYTLQAPERIVQPE